MPVPGSTSFIRGDGLTGDRFWLTDSGSITCDQCGRSEWCSHIEQLITENGDAENLWEQNQLLTSIQIPMFPTHDLWTRVSLQYVTKVDAYKIGIPTDEGTESIFIGFLHRGEGRNVIRQIILDWFDGLVSRTVDLKCLSASHKIVAESVWQSSMKHPHKRLLELWSVWDTHSCTMCNSALGDTSDLVPDASSTRRSVF